MTSYIKSQEGLISLLASLIIGFLLVSISVSAAILATKESRNASDFTQSLRAYYAAEAGVEDAVLKVKQNISNISSIVSNDCSQAANIVAGAAYTCQKINQTTNSLTGVLGLEQPVQISANGFDRVVVSWDLSTDSVISRPPADLVFPPGSSQAWPYPAVMDLSIIRYNSSLNYDSQGDSTDFSIKSAILRPGTTGATVSFGSIGPSTGPIQTSCTSNLSYSCQMSITDFSPGTNYILRLRPRYGGTHYRLQFYNGANLVAVADQFVTIDVTAKSGDAFRRVVAKIEVKQGVAAGLDYVLFSDTDICKNFEVDSNAPNQVTDGLCAF